MSSGSHETDFMENTLKISNKPTEKLKIFQDHDKKRKMWNIGHFQGKRSAIKHTLGTA